MKLDYVLLCGMGALLFFSVGTVLVGIGYCLRKNWQIKKAQKKQGYRQINFQTDISHTNETTHSVDNDFETFKNEEQDHEDFNEDGEKGAVIASWLLTLLVSE